MLEFPMETFQTRGVQISTGGKTKPTGNLIQYGSPYPAGIDVFEPDTQGDLVTRRRPYRETAKS